MTKLTNKLRALINEDNYLQIQGQDCEYFLVEDKPTNATIFDDTQTVPVIRNNLTLNDERIWVKEPVLHAGLARMLTKRSLAYSFNLRKIHHPKCMFIILNGKLTSGGENGTYCYDMEDVNKPLSKNCGIELAIEHMESFPYRVLIKVMTGNEQAPPLLYQISHKMPVILYDNLKNQYLQLCKKRQVSIPSIDLMKTLGKPVQQD